MKFRIALLLAAFLSMPALAGWRDDTSPLPLRGEGKYCVVFICIYNAQLYTSRDPLNYDTPFALVLTYRRSISQERLINTSVDEINRLARQPLPVSTLANWREHMAKAFVDVKSGDSLTGLFIPGKGARFYANNQLTWQVNDPLFARSFFDIWLNEKTRAPALRGELLGVKQ